MSESAGKAPNKGTDASVEERIRSFLERSETIGERAERQYDQTAVNIEVRRDLYDYADPPIYLPTRYRRLPPGSYLTGIEDEITDIERRQTAMLHANGMTSYARGVDLGCGSNAYLWYNHLRHGHKGKMLGIDKFFPIRTEQDFMRLSSSSYPPVARQQGLAERLSQYTEPESLDVVFANGLLYHVDNPILVLDEIYKSLKPGGHLALLTRGSNNMRRLWGYQSLIAAELGKDPRYSELQPGHPFYLDFDIEPHRLALAERFEIVDYFEQSANPRPKSEVITAQAPLPPLPDLIMPEQLMPSYMVFSDKYDWMNIFLALFSLVNDFKFPENISPEDKFHDVQKIIQEYVRPDFDDEIKRNEVFTEYVEQAIFICRKPLLGARPRARIQTPDEQQFDNPT